MKLNPGKRQIYAGKFHICCGDSILSSVSFNQGLIHNGQELIKIESVKFGSNRSVYSQFITDGDPLTDARTDPPSHPLPTSHAHSDALPPIHPSIHSLLITTRRCLRGGHVIVSVMKFSPPEK